MSCCRKTFFANTRLHVSSSVENCDVTLGDERKYIRLNVLPFRPGLRGRGVQVGHICCARLERLVKTKQNQMFRLTDDDSRKPHQTNYRCQVGQRLQYAVGKANTLRRANWCVKANETEAQIEVCRIDLGTLAMTSAAENEAVCQDRTQQAAKNRNQICKKHQEIADGVHRTRYRATVALSATSKS